MLGLEDLRYVIEEGKLGGADIDNFFTEHGIEPDEMRQVAVEKGHEIAEQHSDFISDDPMIVGTTWLLGVMHGLMIADELRQRAEEDTDEY